MMLWTLQLCFELKVYKDFSLFKFLFEIFISRILCDNTDSLDAIQPQAFKLVGSSSANTLQVKIKFK